MLTGSASLFVDNFLDPLPPKVLFVNPPDGAREVPADSEITLTMNRRPLHPGTVTSSNIRLIMEERRGKVVNRPISGDPILAQSHDSVQIVFRPKFPLADEATYRLDLDRRVQDLVGNDIAAFSSRFSIRDEPPRTSDLALTFDENQKQTIADLDFTTASWNESVENALAALFTVAGGSGTAGDLAPTANVNLTPDDFVRGVQILSEGGQDVHVYNFRRINIPSGVTVRFSAPAGGPNNPVKLLSLKPIRIDGILTVSGGDGATPSDTRYTTTRKKTAKGGKAGPSGGIGADTYTGTKINNRTGEHGGDVAYGGEGGRGGQTGNNSRYNMGGGGGGGYVPNKWLFASASGGAGGGAICLQSAGGVTVGAGGELLARGGDGGKIPSRSAYYFGGGGGGGGGGSLLLRATGTMTFEGGTLDVAGGIGAIYGPVSQGIFNPKGGGAPSVALTLWMNLGVVEPDMIRPSASQIVATLFNDTMTIEVLMAIEDPANLGSPSLDALDIADSDGDGQNDDTLDPTTLSEWVPLSDIETLNGNGYQFIRVRVTFQLDDSQTVDQPLPYLDELRVSFRF